MTRSVVVLGFEGCLSLDVTGPLEVFAGANEAVQRTRSRAQGYGVRFAGPSSAPVRAESGLQLLPDGASKSSLDRERPGYRHARDRGRQRAASGRVLRSRGGAARPASCHQGPTLDDVCTGAFVLAAAGLLSNRRATTHWAYCDELSQRFPKIQVERDPIYVRDGRYWTSAGVTAGMDLALALVEADLGRKLSLLVARWLAIFVRRAGGQSQFSEPLKAQSAERAPLRDLQAYIVEHPTAELDVPALAERVAMSPRHFSRIFRAQVGVSPAAYVEAVRVEAARRLLEDSGDGIEGVAAAAGFGTPEALRPSMTSCASPWLAATPSRPAAPSAQRLPIAAPRRILTQRNVVAEELLLRIRAATTP